jgi:hypothetical protein
MVSKKLWECSFESAFAEVERKRCFSLADIRSKKEVKGLPGYLLLSSKGPISSPSSHA